MKTKIKLTLIALFAGVAAMAQTTDLTVMSYNLRFGELASMQQFGEYINSCTPDLVALQECDWATLRERAPHQNGVKFINELAAETGMFAIYGKSLLYKGGYYGIGMLSKYPIIESRRVLLPHHDKTEQRVMLVANIELPSGEVITFVSTHLEVSSSACRVEQTTFINKYFRKWPYAVLLAGDMNAKPASLEMQALVKAGWQPLTNDEPTYSTTKPTTKIDYIFFRPVKSMSVVLNATRVCRDTALSDHAPVISKITLNK